MTLELTRHQLSRSLLHVLVAAIAWLPAYSHGDPDRMRSVLDPHATFFYHLECLSGGIDCSRGDIHDLWVSILSEAEVGRLSERWTSLMKKYSVRVPLNEAAGVEWPDIGPRGAQLDVRWRIQAAAFSGSSDNELPKELGMLMSSEDMQGLDRIRQEAWPAFYRWWSSNELKWQKYKQALEATTDLERMIDRAIKLYENASLEPLTVHLIPRPPGSGVYRGFQKERRILKEFSLESDVTSGAAVVVHEVCHYLYMSAPDEFHQHRIEAFESASSATAGGALAIMNEVLATVVGNGLFTRDRMTAKEYRSFLARHGSFYDDPVIDLAAKAAMPLVSNLIVRDRTFDRAFFNEYFVQMEQALGEDLIDPTVALRVSQIYVTSGELESIARQMADRYDLSSVYINTWGTQGHSATMGFRYGQLSVAIIAYEDDYVDVLSEVLPERKVAVSGRDPYFSCKTQRESGGWLFLYVVPRGHPSIELTNAVPSCRRT